MTRFSAEEDGERQFGRDGMKNGDFIQLLIEAKSGSMHTLTGLVHHVFHKPKAKNQPAPQFNRIRGIWLWVSARAVKKDYASLKQIRQCISVQSAEKLSVTLSWGDAIL